MYIEHLVNRLISNYPYQSWLENSLSNINQSNSSYYLLSELTENSTNFLGGIKINNNLFEKDQSILKENHRDYEKIMQYVTMFADSDIKTYLKGIKDNGNSIGISSVWTKLYPKTTSRIENPLRCNIMHKLDLVEYTIANKLKKRGIDLTILKLKDSSNKHLDFSGFRLNESIPSYEALLEDFYSHSLDRIEKHPSKYLEMKIGEIKKKKSFFLKNMQFNLSLY